MNASEVLIKNLSKSIDAKKLFLTNENEINSFRNAASMLANAYKNGGRLYIAGNGGSAADAQHLAAEFVSKLAKERAPLAAEH